MELTNEFLENLLENLDESIFPIQVDWNKKNLYIKGLRSALIKTVTVQNEPIKEGQRNILMAQTEVLQHCMTEEEFMKVIDVYIEITERLTIEKGCMKK